MRQVNANMQRLKGNARPLQAFALAWLRLQEDASAVIEASVELHDGPTKINEEGVAAAGVVDSGSGAPV